MKKMRKSAAVVLSVMLAGVLSVTALAAGGDFGAAAVDGSRSYTLSEMLTYAVQDEYLAQAEYNEIIAALDAGRPFTNIVNAEATHIAELTPLFTEYGVALPENTADASAAAPASLAEAYQAGAEAERQNIAMYETFLKQELPDDVRAVFTELKQASEHHLAAFERSAGRADGSGAGRARAETGAAAGASRGDGEGSSNGGAGRYGGSGRGAGTGVCTAQES